MCQKYKPDSFRHVLWKQQIDASSRQDASAVCIAARSQHLETRVLEMPGTNIWSPENESNGRKCNDLPYIWKFLL